MTIGIIFFKGRRRFLRAFQIAVKNIAMKLSDTIPLKMPESHRIAIFRFKSAKYTVLTFPILNLFEQFRRAANFYFLVGNKKSNTFYLSKCENPHS
jgi:lysyl-tRNA synthetase class I